MCVDLTLMYVLNDPKTLLQISIDKPDPIGLPCVDVFPVIDL